jgi:hypothetical protein
MNPFKFKYKVGNLFTDQECNDILRDISLQDDKFKVTPDFGELDISVYETNLNTIEDCEGKRIIDLRIKELEKRLGVKYDGDKFIIRYCDDKLEMKPHYDAYAKSTLIYLTTDFEGGSTNFPIAGLEHKPQDFKPGHYIHYNSKHFFSFHGGMSVTKGTKIVIVLRSTKNNIWTYVLGIPWMFLCVGFLFIIERFFNRGIRKNPKSGGLTNSNNDIDTIEENTIEK